GQEELRYVVIEIGQKGVRRSANEAVCPQDTSREVTQIPGQDMRGFGLDRRCHHMAVTGIGQADGLNVLLISRNCGVRRAMVMSCFVVFRRSTDRSGALATRLRIHSSWISSVQRA